LQTIIIANIRQKSAYWGKFRSKSTELPLWVLRSYEVKILIQKAQTEHADVGNFPGVFPADGMRNTVKSIDNRLFFL
jgi:hypothetical protein